MPKYLYTAKSSSGESKGGEIIAKDEKSLVQQLRGDNFFITSIKVLDDEKEKASINFLNRFLNVPLKEKMIFARNLSVMVASGVTVSRAVHNLSLQTQNKSFKRILIKIYEELQSGKQLSEGLAEYPGVFNDLFVNMVRVGEVGGNLEEVLDIVASQLEKDHDLVSKVRGAMIYPAVILTAMIGIAVIMLTYVLPKILGVFKDMDVELPPTTRAVIAISDFMQKHTILVPLVIVGGIILLKMGLQTESGKKILSFLTIKTPGIKNIVIKVNCARFSRVYSSLLKSGVSAVDALQIVSNTLSNYYFKQVMNSSIEKIQKGTNLSKIIAEYPNIFPILVPQMLEVGEETGKTETVLLKLAEFYEEEVNQITKNLSSIIEPVLMILIGSAVGVFAVSMLQPMYSLMENIK
jgi:type IV pilus assembly protein PilC